MTTLLIICVWGYAWTYFSMFCHEMGHFTFAKLAGMSPYLVIIGKSQKLLKLQLFNAVFELRNLSYGRITHAYHLTFDGMKLEYIFFIIGEIFTNFIILLLLINLLTVQSPLIIWVSILIKVLSLFNNIKPTELKIYEKKHL